MNERDANQINGVAEYVIEEITAYPNIGRFYILEKYAAHRISRCTDFNSQLSELLVKTAYKFIYIENVCYSDTLSEYRIREIIDKQKADSLDKIKDFIINHVNKLSLSMKDLSRLVKYVKFEIKHLADSEFDQHDKEINQKANKLYDVIFTDYWHKKIEDEIEASFANN